MASKAYTLKTFVAALIFVVVAGAAAQKAPDLSGDVDALAKQIAGESGTPAEKTRKLVTWITGNLAWTATDYQQRTPEEIIARRGGNCAELARVLARMLRPAGVRYRWISEINLQPYSAERQQHAEQLVQRIGLRGSVFGARHNDHRWLEIYDGANWIPADPAMGVVGIEPWIRMRLAFALRPAPAVAATAAVARDMIAPVVVVALPSEAGGIAEDRTQYYLVDSFNAAYGGKLSSLPAWKDWLAGLNELAPLAISAFQGRANLHQANDAIARLADTFARLQQQANDRGLALDGARQAQPLQQVSGQALSAP